MLDINHGKLVFKIPQIPKIPKVSPKVAKYGIQCINPVQIKWKTLIGSGSYGKIYNGIYNNSPVALKYLSNVEDDQILKEAGFLSKLEHPNIVKFFGMCPEEKTIVLEYLCFSLVPFGSNSVVNNLEELLGELNKCNMIGFEHLIPIIAKHVVSGLTYLHNEGVAHRDIKPGNIIVSNQHMTNRNMESEWKLNPITAKLTDFGESWGKITTTSSITQTHTLNAFKGTMAFMAPEVIESRGIVRRTSEGDMQKSDVWSLGMLFFCLLNPSYKAPYYKEYKKQHLPWEDFIKMQIVGPSLPENCETYNYLHVTDWIGVFEAYKACLKNDPKERSSLGNLWNILEETILPHFYQLRCHQGSVLELSQKKSLNSDTIFEIPLNDGTNACTFLTLKIAEFLLNLEFTAWETLVKPIECIIKYFPQDINPIRDIEKHYEVGEALQILHINGYLKDIEVNFICESCDVFSDDGKQDLLSVLKNSRDVYAVTVPPYTFLVGWLHDSYICIDTHVIDTCVGGNNNGIIVIFSNYVHAARWIWKRLVASGIRRAPVQMVKVIISDPKSYPHSPLHHTTFEYNTSVYQTSNEEPKLEYNNASEDHRTTKHPTTTKDPTIVYHTPIHVQSPVKNTIQDKTLVDLHHQTIREQIPISTIVDHSSVNQHSPESSSFYLEPKMDPKKSNSCNFWNNKPVKYFGLKRLPYIPFVTKKLSHSELMALVMSKAAKCVGVPQGCRKNSVFLIDNRSLKDPTDLKSDLNGTFSKSIEVKTMTVIVSEISGVFSVHAKHRSKVELDTPHLYLNVHRVKNVHGLIRNISYFFDKAEEILNSAIVVQYIVDQAVAGEVDEVTFEVKSHGNRNVSEKSTPFHPVKKSTISAIKIDSRLGKRGSSSIYSESMSKTDGIRDFGDFPRSKKQIADIANKTPGHSKTTAMDEVEALLAFNHELEGDQVIWHHSDLPSDLWVLGTRRMIFNLKVYTGQPISVDPTFNYGKYEVTPFTYRHPLIQSKSKHTSEWVNAVMIGPTVIQHSKAEDVYDGAFRVIAHKTGLKDAKIGILTDGEQALINALKPNFPKAVHMRCTNHFKSNCKEFLLQKGISGSSQEVCLDMIFGENGIIEAENKKQLHTELKNLEQILLELGEEGRLFFEYIKDREKSVLRKLIRDNRRNGGMEEQHGIPVRVYTNQSETCNSMLAAKKKALGYTKKDDLSKSTFIKEIWMDLVKSQDIELEKALYGQSERFRLIPAAKYLQVEIEDWYQLTGTQKRSYVEDFNAMSYTDIQTNKAIVLKEDSSDMSRQVKEKLSVSLPRSLPFVPHARLLEKKAEDLLNSPNTISIAPTHDVVDNNKISYLVAGNNTTYSVTLRNDTVTCKCKSFRYLNICSHSVAIAEKHHVLRLHISKVKVHKRNSLTYPVDQHGSGRKGNAIRQKRFYRPTGSPPKKGLFTKIWHNNEPFLILKSNTITPNKSHCQQCNNEFPRGALSIIPYDIVLSHSERWEYLNRDRTSLDDPKYLPSPAGKMSTKYYCVRKECIFQRFPYFTPSLIQPSVDFELRESHFKLLKEELDYNPIN